MAEVSSLSLLKLLRCNIDVTKIEGAALIYSTPGLNDGAVPADYSEDRSSNASQRPSFDASKSFRKGEPIIFRVGCLLNPCQFFLFLHDGTSGQDASNVILELGHSFD